MASIDSLRPEQRAVLSLVLEKGRGYADIAVLLRIDEAAVRERAHSALDTLGPRDGTPPPPRRREMIGDFLLGQQSESEAKRTREYLEGSAAGRAWARVLAAELRELAAGQLPEIPVEAAAEHRAAPASPRPGSSTAAAPPARPPVSRRGGAFLLGGLVVVAGAVVAIVLSTGGSSHRHTSSGGGATGATGASGPAPKILAQINLNPPVASQGQRGAAQIVQEGSTNVLAIEVQGVKQPGRFAYAVWLYNSHTSAQRLGFVQQVSGGRFQVGTPLPANYGQYRAVIVTQETSSAGGRPGPIVLSGAVPGHTLH
jgi:hypothetical protein